MRARHHNGLITHDKFGLSRTSPSRVRWARRPPQRRAFRAMTDDRQHGPERCYDHPALGEHPPNRARRIGRTVGLGLVLRDYPRKSALNPCARSKVMTLETCDKIGHRLPHSTELYQMHILGEIKGIHLFALGAIRSRHSCSVRLPTLAWATKIFSVSAATKRFRCSANAAVVRRCCAANGDRTRRQLSATRVRQVAGSRICSMQRAGQTTTGAMPRSRRSRYSFSMGAWKPPMTGTPASRSARARS